MTPFVIVCTRRVSHASLPLRRLTNPTSWAHLPSTLPSPFSRFGRVADFRIVTHAPSSAHPTHPQAAIRSPAMALQASTAPSHTAPLPLNCHTSSPRTTRPTTDVQTPVISVETRRPFGLVSYSRPSVILLDPSLIFCSVQRPTPLEMPPMPRTNASHRTRQAEYSRLPVQHRSPPPRQQGRPVEREEPRVLRPPLLRVGQRAPAWSR